MKPAELVRSKSRFQVLDNAGVFRQAPGIPRDADDLECLV
jgi:hypothetical protein